MWSANRHSSANFTYCNAAAAQNKKRMSGQIFGVFYVWVVFCFFYDHCTRWRSFKWNCVVWYIVVNRIEEWRRTMNKRKKKWTQCCGLKKTNACINSTLSVRSPSPYTYKSFNVFSTSAPQCSKSKWELWMFFIFDSYKKKVLGSLSSSLLFFFGFHLTTKLHWFTLVANLCVFFCCWIGGQRCARTVVHSLIRFLSIFAFRRDSHPIYCCTDNIVQVNNFEIIGSSSMHFTDNTSFHQTAHTYTHAHLIYQFDLYSCGAFLLWDTNCTTIQNAIMLVSLHAWIYAALFPLQWLTLEFHSKTHILTC